MLPTSIKRYFQNVKSSFQGMENLFDVVDPVILEKLVTWPGFSTLIKPWALEVDLVEFGYVPGSTYTIFDKDFNLLYRATSTDGNFGNNESDFEVSKTTNNGDILYIHFQTANGPVLGLLWVVNRIQEDIQNRQLNTWRSQREHFNRKQTAHEIFLRTLGLPGTNSTLRIHFLPGNWRSPKTPAQILNSGSTRVSDIDTAVQPVVYLSPKESGWYYFQVITKQETTLAGQLSSIKGIGTFRLREKNGAYYFDGSNLNLSASVPRDSELVSSHIQRNNLVSFLRVDADVLVSTPIPQLISTSLLTATPSKTVILQPPEVEITDFTSVPGTGFWLQSTDSLELRLFKSPRLYVSNSKYSDRAKHLDLISEGVLRARYYTGRVVGRVDLISETMLFANGGAFIPMEALPMLSNSTLNAEIYSRINMASDLETSSRLLARLPVNSSGSNILYTTLNYLTLELGDESTLTISTSIAIQVRKFVGTPTLVSDSDFYARYNVRKVYQLFPRLISESVVVQAFNTPRLASELESFSALSARYGSLQVMAYFSPLISDSELVATYGVAAYTDVAVPLVTESSLSVGVFSV